VTNLVELLAHIVGTFSTCFVSTHEPQPPLSMRRAAIRVNIAAAIIYTARRLGYTPANT
jgi:hypothetical protein